MRTLNPLMAVTAALFAATLTVPAAAEEVGFIDAPTTKPATLETDVQRIVRIAQEAKPQAVPGALAERLAAAKQGDTIFMEGFNMEALPILPVTQFAGGPPLLFADDPEYIRVPEGAVLRERINPGPHRFYLYHVNGTTGTIRKISTVIENLSDEPMRLRFTRYAFPGVSQDYGRLGRMGIKLFLESEDELADEGRFIPPRTAVPFDEAVETTTVKFNELVHAWYEFEVDQPALVTVLQTDPETPSPVAAARIKELLPPRSRSGAGRGYYPYSEYDVTLLAPHVVDTAQGARQIFVADGHLDRWLTGFDSTSTIPVLLKGNYGVVYNMSIPYESTDGQHLAVLMWNARTRSGCKAMTAAVGVGAGGKFGEGTVLVPTDQNYLRGDDSAVLLQVLPPPAEGRQGTLRLQYSPPGASCLPTPILLVPIPAPAAP